MGFSGISCCVPVPAMTERVRGLLMSDFGKGSEPQHKVGKNVCR